MQYGDEPRYSATALYGVSGAVLVALGVGFGLLLVVSGLR